MDKDKLQDLIFDGKIDEFNQAIQNEGGIVDLSGLRLRGTDLRCIKFEKINLESAYLKASDLRGMDLSQSNMKHASIQNAKISGVLFPDNISADEIELSLKYGTRMRTK